MPLVLSGTSGISTNGTNWAYQLDSSGRPFKPNLPYASASISSAASSTGVPAPFEASMTESRGVTVDNTNGRFTVPVAGLYFVGHHNLGNQGTGGCHIIMRKNGSAFTGSQTQDTNNSNDNFSQQYIIQLAANDYIDYFQNGGRFHNNQNYSRFWIFLLG